MSSSAHPTRRGAGRHLVRAALVGSLATGLLVVASPSSRAAVAVGSLGDLQTGLATCTSPYDVTLTADLSGTSTELVVGCDATVDLAGHDLTVRNVVLGLNTSLEVTDSTPAADGPDPNVDAGALTADASEVTGKAGIQTTGAVFVTSGTATVVALGGADGAGIGGSNVGSGGSTSSWDTSRITATGGADGAGIGGGWGGLGGLTNSYDASVITATGGEGGAGIGGGRYSSGTSTSLNGTSTVTATGGFRAAGIGGGEDGEAGGTTIHDDALVVATGGGGVGTSAVGTGFGGQVWAGTFLTVTGGRLELGSDLQVWYYSAPVAPPAVVVGADGVIARRTTPASSAVINGDGTILNDGAITLPADAIWPAIGIRHDHFRVGFDTQGGSEAPDDVVVYADTFARGDRTLPPDPTRPGDQFVGWNTAADGTGTDVTATTVLPGSSNDGEAVPVTLHAQYVPATAPDAPAQPTAVRGDRRATVSWTAPAANGAPITGYTVTASPGGASVTVSGADTLSTPVTGLTNGTAYTFTVVATNGVGDSPASEPSDAVTPAGVPGRPMKPTVQVRAARVTVSWAAPPANGAPVTGYRVDISRGPDQLRPGTARSATFKGLKPGRYTFRVVATNAVGSSAPSRPVAVRVR